MRVMRQSPDPLARMHTMTKRQGKSGTIDVKALVAEDEEFLRALVRTALQEVLEAEMTEALGAEKGERAAGRQGYRSGYYGRTLVTRVGKLELRVPQDRTGRFSTELFERYQRSERALVAALAEMYVQGVSTRKVKAITEELCGHSFSASSISAMNQRLDASLAHFAGRPLAEAFPYLILDARYERVREAGVIVSQAVLIAIGIDWDGRRQRCYGASGEDKASSSLEPPTGCPMPQPNDLSRSLAAVDQDSTLIAVIEMSQSTW